MATMQLDHPPPLGPAVDAALGGLRGRIRRYVWLEGLGAAAVWLGLAFWVSLAIDWLFEPPVVVRTALLAIAAAGLLVVLFRFIGRRLFVRLTDTNMATLLERRFPELNDSLLTSVVLAGRSPEAAGYDAAMLAVTVEEAQDRLRGLRLPEVFNPMPLRRKAVVALGLALTIGGLARLAPDVLEIWAQRNLALGERMWPRKIRLEPVGFVDGVAKVPTGADFKLVVRAFHGDTEIPDVPDSVEVRYKFESGGRFRREMDRTGARSLDAESGDEVLQEYDFTFRGILSPIHLEIVGGDVHLRDLTIQTVPPPTLKPIELEYEYPAYMERPRRTEKVEGGSAEVPLGTRLTIHCEADKPLQQVQIDRPGSQRAAAPLLLEGAALGPDGRHFSYPLDPFPFPRDPAASGPREVTLTFTLTDTDGIKSRDPIRLTLIAQPDDPPQVAVGLTGIGTAITPQARLPVDGEISDDHGLGRAWFEYAINGQKPGVTPLARLDGHPLKFPVKDIALEVRDLKLARKDKIALCVKAEDLCNLGRGPNSGTSETWLLEVVSPDELRLMLEGHELVLRQRLDVIIQEVTDTRDYLLKMDFSAEGAGPQPKAGKAPGAEPGDRDAGPKKLTEEQKTARRLERVMQALQNCLKNKQETLGVAASIDGIRLQWANNRIETEELRDRLGAGVSAPLHRIHKDMFPELQRRLEDLQALVADREKGPARRLAACQKADEILLAMRRVRDRMIELGNFNELVETLRAIIDLQEKINKDTNDRHKQRIRDLLE